MVGEGKWDFGAGSLCYICYSHSKWVVKVKQEWLKMESRGLFIRSLGLRGVRRLC